MLSLVALIVSGNAMADWVRVHSNDNLTVYADPSTIRSKLNIVRLSTMFDFKAENYLKSDGTPYFSIMRETEYNCRENLQRMISYAIYSGRMGKGKMLVGSTESQDWQSVSRARLAQDVKKYACK